MQLGFVLLLAAIAIAMAAALIEESHPLRSWGLSILCGIMMLAAAWDIEVHPQGLIRAWGPGVAQVVIVFLRIAGIGIELGCVWWIIKRGWRRTRR